MSLNTSLSAPWNFSSTHCACLDCYLNAHVPPLRGKNAYRSPKYWDDFSYLDTSSSDDDNSVLDKAIRGPYHSEDDDEYSNHKFEDEHEDEHEHVHECHHRNQNHTTIFPTLPYTMSAYRQVSKKLYKNNGHTMRKRVYELENRRLSTIETSSNGDHNSRFNKFSTICSQDSTRNLWLEVSKLDQQVNELVGEYYRVSLNKQKRWEFFEIIHKEAVANGFISRRNNSAFLTQSEFFKLPIVGHLLWRPSMELKILDSYSKRTKTNRFFRDLNFENLKALANFSPKPTWVYHIPASTSFPKFLFDAAEEPHFLSSQGGKLQPKDIPHYHRLPMKLSTRTPCVRNTNFRKASIASRAHKNCWVPKSVSGSIGAGAPVITGKNRSKSKLNSNVPFLEVDLGGPCLVTHVSTMARYPQIYMWPTESQISQLFNITPREYTHPRFRVVVEDQPLYHVAAFQLLYRVDSGTPWITVDVFQGNDDFVHQVVHSLKPYAQSSETEGIVTRFLRFVPISKHTAFSREGNTNKWNSSCCGLRVGVHGKEIHHDRHHHQRGRRSGRGKVDPMISMQDDTEEETLKTYVVERPDLRKNPYYMTKSFRMGCTCCIGWDETRSRACKKKYYSVLCRDEMRDLAEAGVNLYRQRKTPACVIKIKVE